jgi:hypothetical protein
MLRAIFSTLIVVLLAQTAMAAQQVITCENRKQGLTIRAKLGDMADDLAATDVQVAVLMKKNSHFQGTLKNEKIMGTQTTGQIAISGQAESNNFSLQLVMPKEKLKRRFKDVTLSAFLDNPISDSGFYPNRVSVKCSSQIN